MPTRSQDCLHNIWNFYKKEDWMRVLEEHEKSGGRSRCLLWPKPSEADVHFIGRSVRGLGLSGVVSVGCGSGLLEWLLLSATGLPVWGIEVDRKYWTQPSWEERKFLCAVFPEDNDFEYLTTNEKNALMFCYFNNATEFRKYINNYEGRCLIIIGPHNTGRYTEPRPFDPVFSENGWLLVDSKEIGHSQDFIAVYKRLT